MEAEVFHGDRRTDVTKLIVAFRSFANAFTNIYSNAESRLSEFYKTELWGPVQGSNLFNLSHMEHENALFRRTV